MDLDSPTLNELMTLEAAATGFFSTQLPLRPDTSAVDLQLEPECEVDGYVDWQKSKRSFLGGAWGLFAIVVNRGHEPDDLLDEVLRLRNSHTLSSLRAVRSSRYTDAQRIVEERAGSAVFAIPIVGRSFRINGLHRGDHCLFVLFLDDSEPFFTDCDMVRRKQSVGRIFVPGLAHLIVHLRAENGDPLPPIGTVWCLDARVQNARVPWALRHRELYFDEARADTFTGFWVRWGEEYLVGAESSGAIDQRRVRIPWPSETIHVDLVERDGRGLQDRTTLVVDEDGEPIPDPWLIVEREGGPESRRFEGREGSIAWSIGDQVESKVRIGASGFLTLESEVAGVPAVAVLERRTRHTVHLVDRSAMPIGGIVSLTSFGEVVSTPRVLDSAETKARNGVLTYDEPDQAVDLVIAAIDGFRPIVLFDRLASADGPGIILLEDAMPCDVLVSDSLQDEALLNQSLMSSIVLKLHVPGTPDGVFLERRVGLALPEGVAETEIWAADESVEVAWTRYASTDLELGSLIPVPRGRRVELRIPRPYRP